MSVKKRSNGRTFAIVAAVVGLKFRKVEKVEFLQGAKAW
jgi:hypothetical protein